MKHAYRFRLSLIALFLVLCSLFASCNTSFDSTTETPAPTYTQTTPQPFDYLNLPDYSGKPYIPINNNVPYFTNDESTNTGSYEHYAPLDALGRCGVTMACIGRDLMPTEDRESISHVYPSGWVQATYDGAYLYNRAHLIGFQLTGENDNPKNLITGTRYFNVNGMLTFENMVADYIKETNNHVLYRVTPIFVGNELVARGVLMEAWSLEDGGDGICFNVFVYNVQPGIEIDYATGKSHPAGEAVTPEPDNGEGEKQDYILNKNSGTFHSPNCTLVSRMNAENKQYITATHDEMIEDGYSPCGTCKP